MLGAIEHADVSSVLFNVASLASWDALPLLLLTYAFQSTHARHMRPEFSLRRSEASELDRATLLYARVCRTLNEIERSTRDRNGFWRALFSLERGVGPTDTEEREDLQAYSDYLRVNIVRLRRLPLERLRTFVHTVSLRSALRCALGVYVVAFAAEALLLLLRFSNQFASSHELTTVAPPFFVHNLFQTNAIGGCLAIVTIPLFYLSSRAALRREFGLEFHVLGDLAATPPDRENGHVEVDPNLWAEADRSEDSTDDWSTILGVAPSASVEQVKEAYKVLIKQSHPDRLNDMSPAIKRFADAETKRLNAAYQQALSSVG